MNDWLLVAALVLSLFGAMCADAAPPPGTDLQSSEHAWWEGAHVPGTTVPCCGTADGKVVQAQQTAHGWQVMLDGKWQDVPPSAVLDDYPAHPSGSAAVWIIGGRIACFVKPDAGG